MDLRAAILHALWPFKKNRGCRYAKWWHAMKEQDKQAEANLNDPMTRVQGGRQTRWMSLAAVGLVGLVLGAWFARSGATIATAQGLPLWGLFAILVVIAGGAWARTRRAAEVADAHRDPVSGLYTQAYADEAVGAMIVRDDRAGGSRLALVLLRSDYDEQTHERYGDAGLRAERRFLGEQIRGQIRAGDLPSHLGDNMVAVYLGCEETEQALAFARRIGMLISGQQIDFHGDVIKVSASMGIVQRLPGESHDALVARAAERLGAARRAGAGSLFS